jgi:hypothetical protein
VTPEDKAIVLKAFDTPFEQIKEARAMISLVASNGMYVISGASGPPARSTGSLKWSFPTDARVT